jgi:hypothetical protein
MRGHPNLTPALALQGFEDSKADAARNLVILLAGMGAVLLWRRKSLPKAAFGGALVVFLLFDLWTVASKAMVYQEPTDQSRIFEEPDFVAFVRSDTTLFRILPVPQNPPPNWYAYFRLQNVSGYHPAKLTVYQDLMDDAGGLGNPALRSLFGTKYVILDREVSHPDLELAFRGSYLVYRYLPALPRAWFAPSVTVLASEDSVLARLKEPAFRPGDEVLLSQAPPATVAGLKGEEGAPALEGGSEGARAAPDTTTPGGAGSAEARVLHFGFHDLSIAARTDRERLLFVSEMFYPPGWTATLDDLEVPILQANHAFRAVVVPPGEHRIRFRYRSESFERGIRISAVSYGLVLLVLVAGQAARFVRKPRGPA